MDWYFYLLKGHIDCDIPCVMRSNTNIEYFIKNNKKNCMKCHENCSPVSPINIVFLPWRHSADFKIIIFLCFFWTLRIYKTGSLMTRHFLNSRRDSTKSRVTCAISLIRRVLSRPGITMCVFTSSLEPDSRGQWFMRHMINQCFIFFQGLVQLKKWHQHAWECHKGSFLYKDISHLRKSW